MTLDKQEQKEMLLALIAASTFNGRTLDIVYELKRAIEEAEVAPSTST